MAMNYLPTQSNQFNNSVEHLISTYKDYLKPNQLELLEHLKTNIYGIYVNDVTRNGPLDVVQGIGIEATLKFEHEGAKGEIIFFL